MGVYQSPVKHEPIEFQPKASLKKSDVKVQHNNARKCLRDR